MTAVEALVAEIVARLVVAAVAGEAERNSWLAAALVQT